MKLSIIVPTLNRFGALRACLESIEEFEPTADYEIIVIDGGSMDGTAEWLGSRKNLVVLQHNYRAGCVKAFNDGFRISRGDYCAQLSDDVVLRDDCLDAACQMLDERPDLGQVVIHHRQNGRMQSPEFATDHGKNLFAAFGLTRRELGDKLGWWGDYHHQYGDPELSIKIYDAGYGIELLPDKFLIHIPGTSKLRHIRNNPDGILFDERWHDWQK